MRNHGALWSIAAVALVRAVCASAASPPISLSFGETVAGSIAVSGEVDSYTFSAVAGDRVLVTMAVTSGGLDPEVRLYNPTGQSICSAHSSLGGAAAFEDCTLPAAGNYTLLASDYGLSETGSYGLYLQRLNNPGGTAALAFGQTLQATLAAAAERDAYTFSATAGDRVLVTMAMTSGGLDPEVRLYNPTGQSICSAHSSLGGAAAFEDCTLPAAGNYTLLASDYGLSETGSYGLYLQRLNNPGGTAALAFGQTLQATLAAAAERDAYTFSATAGDRVLVTMAMTSGGLDPEVRLYNPTGQSICSAHSSLGGAAAFEDCTLPAAGNYTLLASDYGLSETGSYGLYLQRLNNPGGTAALAFGQTLQATLAAAAERDAYTFSATAGDRVLVTMAMTSGGLDPEVRLYNPTGQSICSAHSSLGGAAAFEDCALPTAGNYILLASDYGLSETGSYGLYLQRLNNPGGTAALAFGQTLQATLAAAAERDAYTFSATAGDRVLVTMAVTSGGLDPEVRLYNPTGHLICSAHSSLGGTAAFDECNLPMTGTYTLLTSDYGLTETGSYSLRLNRGPCSLTCAANVPAEGSVGTSLAFSAASPPPSCGASVSYHWDFGDGSTSTAQNAAHSYAAEGPFPWSLRITAGDKTCDRSGSVRILPPGTEPSETVFFDGFDTYAPGSNLGGQGGWVNRWGGGITASSAQSVSPPQSCRMDNGSGCFESQLYHPLSALDVLWLSADILGVPTGRRGCHEFDAVVRLFNPDQGGTWGSSVVAFTLRSGPGEFNLSPGLTVETSNYQVSGVYGSQELVTLEPDYASLTQRWIHLEAKVDRVRHRVDVWVDGEYRASLAIEPAAPPYKGIALDVGEGLGFVDNVRVFKNGPEPGESAAELTLGTPLPTTVLNGRHRFFKVTSRPNRDLLLTVDQTGAVGELEL